MIKTVFDNFLRLAKNKHKKYNRFIILANPRTGTNYLRGILNEHPNVVAFGELFRFNDSIGWDYPGHQHKVPDELLLINQDSTKFLKTKVFVDFPPHVTAVGFKIFYFHARQGPWKSVWPYLQKEQDIKVIHMKRRNVLKTFHSHARALETDKWINLGGKEEKQDPLYLDYQKCLRYFEQIGDYERENDIFFKDHPKLELYYEDIVDACAPQTKRALDFLDVSRRDLCPVTYKQARLPLERLIANYSELKKKFTGSPWEIYFED